jgi:hypothetical protein
MAMAFTKKQQIKNKVIFLMPKEKFSITKILVRYFIFINFQRAFLFSHSNSIRPGGEENLRERETNERR